MDVLMIGREDPAGMMIAFCNAINRYSEHTARCVLLDTPHSSLYDVDIRECDCMVDDDYSEIEHLLTRSNIIHFHNLIDENVAVGPLCVRDYVHGKAFLHHHHGHHDLFINAAMYSERYRRFHRKVVVSTPDLLKVLPDATWQPNLVPIYDVHFLPRMDHLGSNSCVKLVQAPTRKWQKQTASFRKVTEALKREFSFIETHILVDLPQNDCLRFKRNCHISFDHMNGWFGIASLESLSHGLPTLAGLDDWNIECIRKFTGTTENPWILTRSEEELEEKLRLLIQDPAVRINVGKSSRSFMENYWTEQHALGVLLETYRSL